jgi:putative peptidoglycan lipid II flippase
LVSGSLENCTAHRVRRLPATLFLGPIAALNLIIRFAQLTFTLSTLGPGMATDALFAAMVLPQIALSVIVDSGVQVIIPLLSGEQDEVYRTDSWTFLWFTSGLVGLIALSLGVTSHWWIEGVVPGFTSEAKHLTSHLARIQLGAMVCTSAVSVLSSACYARRRFLAAELSPAVGNLAGIGFVVWGLSKYGVSIAAWSVLVSGLVQATILLPILGRPRRPDWNSAGFHEARRRVKPLLFGAIYYKSDVLLDRLLASLAPQGMISLLYTAQQICGATGQVLNRGLIAPIVPSIAVFSKTENWDEIKKIVKWKLKLVLCLTGLGVIIVGLFGKVLLRALIGHGGISNDNLQTLWLLLLSLSGLLVGGALGQVLSSTFYAIGDTRSPTRIGMLGFPIGLGLKVFGFLEYGIIGIAMGASAYSLMNVWLLSWKLSKTLK